MENKRESRGMRMGKRYGTYSASTPHLVKVSEDLFAVMWEERSRTSSTSSFWNPTGEDSVVFCRICR